MIVELIGCAGAGKTTLRRILCRRTIGGLPVMAMPDLALDQPHLPRVTHPTAVNVVQEIGGLPSFVRAWRRDPGFVAYGRETFARHAPSRFAQLNGMRGLVRKVGMYELARTRAPDAVVVSDEGTLLSAYNMFVMNGLEFGRGDLDRFAALVPLPDAVVHVRAPVASLLARARARPDPRRQHIGKDDAAVERDIRRTVELFDLLASLPRVASRALVVDNEDCDAAGSERVADEIAGWLDGVRASERAVPEGEPVLC